MRLNDIKHQIDASLDILFQTGYDLGWNSVTEEIQQRADAEWNLGNTTTARILQKLAQEINGEDWSDVN
jgi:hypothetical protein|tara:strand:- start:212 stop:418 length:207 start_codon:yes stop_codon:yes gene_type:complete